MFKDFFTGASFAVKSCGIFFRDRKIWRYAIIPLMLMLCFYAAAVCGIFYFAETLSALLLSRMDSLPEMLAWLSGFLTFVITLGGVMIAALLPLLFGFFYELIGALFFDALTGYYEQKKYGTVPRKMSFSEMVKYAAESIRFGFRIAVIFTMIFICSLLIPFAGQLILVLIMGYYLGISYMVSTAVNNHCTIKQLEKLCSDKIALVTGFGTTAYLLLCIPLAAIIFFPALVPGAVELFNEKIKECVQ